MSKCVADYFRLLMDFLGHEVLVIALVDQLRRSCRFHDLPLDLAVLLIVDFNAFASEYGPVAVLEITDGIGERRQCDGVRAQIHFSLAVANSQRRPFACTDQKIVFAREWKPQRTSPPPLFERRRDRLGWRLAAFHLL